MREIKFRVWDNAREMFTAVNPFCGFDGNRLRADDGTRFILMQYTGLKDKNGKEIYEGDIVVETEQDDSTLQRTVVWNESFGGWSLFNKSAYEIIGNIYENPELI